MGRNRQACHRDTRRRRPVISPWPRSWNADDCRSYEPPVSRREEALAEFEEHGIGAPDLAAALAEKLAYHGMQPRQAAAQAYDLVMLALTDPERFAAIFAETYH